MSEAESFCLQKSFQIPDPMPDSEISSSATTPSSTPGAVAGSQTPKEDATMPPPSQTTEKKPAGEMDLTKMVLDTSSFLRTTSAQRPSMRYPSRASVSNSSFISAHEYDDLRARFSQAKRELLKLSDIQKDLDLVNFELARTQEEVTLLRESNRTLKREVEDYEQRWEKEHKARMSLETKASTDGANRSEEVTLLKRTIEKLREEKAERLDELAEQHQRELQTRTQSMDEKLASATEEMNRLLEEVTVAQRGKEAAESKLNAALAELDKVRSEVSDGKSKADLLQQQFVQLEQQHREFVAQQEAVRAKDLETQKAHHDAHVQQLTSSRDEALAELRDKLQEGKNKQKALSEELASARHALSELQEDLKQLNADRAKELRRLADEHRLALSEKQLQLEAAVREARGSKTSIEEEAHSLRRQLSQVTSELSSVVGVLAQREKQLAQMDAELTDFKDRCLAAEQENAQLASEAQMNADEAAEKTERFDRLAQERDELEEAFTKDVRELKDRIRSLETALMQSKSELSGLRKEQVKSSDAGAAATRDLREQIEELTGQRAALAAAAAERRRFEEDADDYRKRFEAEKAKASGLAVELTAAVNRCSTLEAKLEEQSRRLVSQAAATRSPMQTLHANSNPALTRAAAKYRSVSSAQSTRTASENSLKRARTEDARVFAISGFDGNEVLLAVKQLPNVAIAECKSNVPVPSNLTHLISNGQLTIKLLTALVRGCWVLPESYVVDSLREHQWLREEDYGFQHEEPPLLKKRVWVTDAFKNCKHFSTATLLVREGGAILVEDPAEADIQLCTNAEARTIEDGWNWERMVDLIYPLKVT